MLLLLGKYAPDNISSLDSVFRLLENDPLLMMILQANPLV